MEKELTLGERMKQYEKTSSYKLDSEQPVIIRIDGKAFHTFTRGFNTPFDDVFRYAMVETTKKLCKEIQNCVLGYTQSDEITLVLIKPREESSLFFDNKIQKICSIAASLATLYFNELFYNLAEYMFDVEKDEKYSKKEFKACFDARCFNVPDYEVSNNLIWRQQDAIKNSVTQVALKFFSDKELHKKNSNDKILMLKEKGVDYFSYKNNYRVGSLIVKVQYEGPQNSIRTKWMEVDTPIFADQQKCFDVIKAIIDKRTLTLEGEKVKL